MPRNRNPAPRESRKLPGTDQPTATESVVSDSRIDDDPVIDLEKHPFSVLMVERRRGEPIDNFVVRILVNCMDSESLRNLLAIERRCARVVSVPLFNSRKQEIYPDCIILSADREAEIECALTAPHGASPPVDVHNAEFVTQVRPSRLSPQCAKYRRGTIDRFGPAIRFHQHVFASRPIANETCLDIDPPHNRRQHQTACTCLLDVPYETLSEAFRATPIGMLSAPLFHGGATAAQFRKIRRLLRDRPNDDASDSLLIYFSAIINMVPSVKPLVLATWPSIEEDLDMASSTFIESICDTPLMRGMLAHMLVHKRPKFERNPQARAAIRSIEHQGRKEGLTAGRKEGREEGQHDERVSSLLTALQTHGITLRPEYVSLLQRTAYNQLPALQVALAAESEQDFVEKANLARNGAVPVSREDV